MTDDEMVLAAAMALSEETHPGQKWLDIYDGTRRKYLRCARVMLTAAEAVRGIPAPVAAPKAPLDPDAMWKAVVEASSS